MNEITCDTPPGAEPAKTKPATRLSYKYQRLRERLRQAIVAGELTGKLPGERDLAKRFNANAKTLGKALTDLAAEGLLDRSIGRGTFVKGTRPQTQTDDRWLILASEDSRESQLVRRLLAANGQCAVVTTSVTDLRPSFVSQFGAVIDLSIATPDAFVRDLIVRNIPVVRVGRESDAYSTHVVTLDRVLAVSQLARDLALRGHRRFAIVEARGNRELATAFRPVVTRYGPDAEVDSCFAADVAVMVDHGVTAIICDSPASARAAADVLLANDVAVPTDVSLAAIGCGESTPDCNGYFVRVDQKLEAILTLLRERPQRPTSLWLTPHAYDAGTIGNASLPHTDAPLVSMMVGT